MTLSTAGSCYRCDNMEISHVAFLKSTLKKLIEIIKFGSHLSGCDHSRFLVAPDWYANGCCRVLALEQTRYSMLNVYLVFKNKVHKVQVSEKYVQTTR